MSSKKWEEIKRDIVESHVWKAIFRHGYEDTPRNRVLMVTANEDAEAAGEALSAGIFAYVPKPFDLPRLEHLVALAISGAPPADAPPDA